MSDDRWKPSVTVAAVVEHGGRYLLIEEHTAEGLKLNQPAGHLDEGESLQQAVVRECLEETACAFVPQALLGVYLARFHRPAHDGQAAQDITYLRFAYCGSVGEPDPGRALDHGIVRTLWLTPDEVRASAARHRSPLVLRCVEDHLAGRRHALDAVSADGSLRAPVLMRPSPP
ncbi:MAG: NUDIX hydrolase [Burkholderiales bacterium PBB5]|nr:MAG: NUDIX hydrolase [Burkholderiales bacterium PBB5]